MAARGFFRRILSVYTPTSRPLTTGKQVKGRTDQEIAEWVKKEESQGWRSYGYFPWDRKRDAFYAHFITFVTCLAMFPPLWVWRYLPDADRRHWAHREAYMVLRERELAGVEPISKDFIDPAKIVLPSDEELGQLEIII